MVILKETRLSELSRFLKGRRAMLQPEILGITTTRRRRIRGLRREEVADAAGISAAWYIRLEQGRDVRASLHALDRIGRALKLDAPEQAYLLELARPDLDWRNKVRSHEAPSHTLLAMVSGLMPHPAYVLNKYWQVKACNRAARVLLGDLGNEEEWGANLAVRLFQDPSMRHRFVDWPLIARSLVAQMRLSSATMTGDPILAGLISQLSVASPDFKKLWDAVEISESPTWKKVLAHHLAGKLIFNFSAFTAPGPDCNFILAIHTPADDKTRVRLKNLLESIAS